MNNSGYVNHFYNALVNLVGDSNFQIIGDDKYENITEWRNVKTPPTKNQVEAEVKRLKQIEKDTEYKKQRAKEYPSLGDQLDALFKAGVFPKEMADQIQAIKDKYPKPEVK